MGGLRAEYRKKLRSSMESAPVTEEMVKRQLSLAAGTEAFQHRDPIYHLTESFRQTFDLMGQMRARGERPDPGAMAERYAMGDEAPGMREHAGIQPFGVQTESGENAGGRENAETGESAGALSQKTDMSPFYRPRDPQRRMMDRFAEVTFQRGSLSAALLRGQGKMMLFTCLNRTVGQEKSRQQWERMLFQRSSSHRLIPSRQGDIAVVNRHFTDSAVGLVVDVLKDARQSLDSFTALAEGKVGHAGMGTLHKQYPFLTDAYEQELLAEYRARLARLKGPGCEEERMVLERAQEKVEAIIQKKARMKVDFLQKLRWLSYCAASAEAEFSQEEFRREAARSLEPEEPEDTPPDDGGGEGGAPGPADGNGRRKRRGRKSGDAP